MGPNCNAGTEGVLVYNTTQSQFFVCTSSQWTAINLQGPTGTAGAAGPQGPQGPQGPAGSNGLNGSGAGGLTLKDASGRVQGYLIQFGIQYDAQSALMMLPSMDLIYINVQTGQFTTGPGEVYYSGSNCTGTAYAGRTDKTGPHILNRIYVGNNGSGYPARFFHADSYVSGAIFYTSMRIYDTYGQMDQCVSASGIWQDPMTMQVSEMSQPPASLTSLAPIHFSPY